MENNSKIIIPIICENPQCLNFSHQINSVSEIAEDDIDLFYESYDGSDERDYCPICKNLGVAEDYIINPI